MEEASSCCGALGKPFCLKMQAHPGTSHMPLNIQGLCDSLVALQTVEMEASVIWFRSLCCQCHNESHTTGDFIATSTLASSPLRYHWYSVLVLKA